MRMKRTSEVRLKEIMKKDYLGAVMKRLRYLVALLFISPTFAYDTNKAAYLTDLWTSVQDFLTGTGGLILAAVLIGMGIYMLAGRGQLIWGIAMMFLGVLIKLIPNIASGMGFVF